MIKYIDYKATTWIRLHCNVDDPQTEKNILQAIEAGEHPLELLNNGDFEAESEVLFYAEEPVKFEDSNGFPVVEVYDNDYNLLLQK